MKKVLSLFAVALVSLVALCQPQAAQATQVEVSTTAIGPALWRLDYSVFTGAAPPTFDEVTIWFGLATTTSIVSFDAPAGWDPLIVKPDAAIPADGFVDALRLAGPLPATSTYAFSVVLGAATAPGSQPFDLIVSTPFHVVESGLTTTVPEPCRLALTVAGLLVLGLVSRRYRGGNDARLRS